jgi:hypothetical protein
MTAEGGIPDPSVHTRARIDELLAEIKRLRAALKPFADEAWRWNATCPDDYRVGALCVGDFRRSHAALR